MKKVTFFCRLYKTVKDRKIAVALLKKRGNNYFVGFINNDGIEVTAGLSFGNADWVPSGEVYSKDINRLIH